MKIYDKKLAYPYFVWMVLFTVVPLFIVVYYAMTDAEGNYYAVGERESSWGITKKQFGFYIGIGLGAVILVVAIAMISVNIVKKSRAKAAAEHAAALGGGGTDDIDEDALRLEILQEMLAERQKNREEQG